MATKYSNNLEVLINQPLDTKYVCENLSDLTSYLYVGLLTYQKSDGKYYSYKGKVDGNHVWEEIKGGAGLPTTNLIKNSNFDDGSTKDWNIVTEQYSDYSVESSGLNGYNEFVARKTTISTTYTLKFEQGKVYTLSCYYKVPIWDGTGYFALESGNIADNDIEVLSKSDNVSIQGVWAFNDMPKSDFTLAYVTFLARNNFEATLGVDFQGGGSSDYMHITNLQLEEGDKVTDYARWEDRIVTGEELEEKQDVLVSGTNIKTINGNSILGNGNIEIKGSDLGISSPLYYLGITTTEMVDGYTYADVTIGDEVVTATTGAVVFYNDAEFVYNGSTWEELGSGSLSTKYDTTLGDLATETTIGGIPAGTTADSLKNKTFTQMFDTLLFPDKDPTHSNPSVGGFALSPATSPVEINSAVATISSATLNKGQWNQYNGGLAYAGDITSTVYEIKINGSTYDSITGLPSVYTTPGNHTYKATVNYAAGPTPVNNKGVQRPSLAAPAGAVTATRTVNVTYPYYIMGASGLVKNLTACTISGTNGTITATLNHTVPAVNADSDKTVIKVKGTLSSLMIVDPFATGGKSDLLPDLISSEEVDTGYTIYSYTSDTVKGEVVITNLTIAFTI